MIFKPTIRNNTGNRIPVTAVLIKIVTILGRQREGSMRYPRCLAIVVTEYFYLKVRSIHVVIVSESTN